jgi:hypothetical protein
MAMDHHTPFSRLAVLGAVQPLQTDGAQAGHAIGQHHRRDPAQFLKAFCHQRQRRRTPLIGGEAHEAVTAPRQDRTEEVQPAFGPPVEHQVLARHWHPRPVGAPPLTPDRFGIGHRPSEVARRAGVAGRLRYGQ